MAHVLDTLDRLPTPNFIGFIDSILTIS